MSAQKRKRRPEELNSSSESEEERSLRQEKAQNTAGRRHSERIELRKRRPQLRRPSRDKVWDSIPSERSPLKYKSPRKTVSDFTKVYNTYNFDDFEDTSDDELDNFLTESSNSSLSDDGMKLAGTRLKNYHRRIRVQSSSSNDESEIKGGNFTLKIDQKAQSAQIEDGISEEVCAEVNIQEKQSLKGEDKEESEVVTSQDCNEYDNGDSDEMTPCKRRRNVSVLESDDEDDAAATAAASEISISAVKPPAETTTIDHEDGSSSDSDSSSDDGESRASKLRRQSREVFQQFKEIQAKRKASL